MLFLSVRPNLFFVQLFESVVDTPAPWLLEKQTHCRVSGATGIGVSYSHSAFSDKRCTCPTSGRTGFQCCPRSHRPLHLLVDSVPPEKLAKIIDQIRTIQASSRLKVRDLQSLWLTSAWHYLRPLLTPLYKALHRIPNHNTRCFTRNFTFSDSRVGMDHTTVQAMITQLDKHLQLRSSLTQTSRSPRSYTVSDGQQMSIIAHQVPSCWVP